MARLAPASLQAGRLQPRRGAAATWTQLDPVLLAGEEGYETDTGRSKLGDGTTSWTSLDYAEAAEVTTAIEAHDESETAHEDIRAELDALSESVGSGSAGIGDAIRIYSNSGTQALPSGAFTKITLFDTQVSPANGWPLGDYGDMSGGDTFEWDVPNDRIRVLRNCVVLPFLNADCNLVDVPLVDPATGKQVVSPYLVYTLRMSAGGSIGYPVDGTNAPATRALGAGYGDGGGNSGLPAFNAKAGDYLELWIGSIGAATTLNYADITFRNIANTA